MKLHERKVKIIVNQKKYTVPFEVYNLINNQRETNSFYIHLLSLWYYKCFINKSEINNNISLFENQFASCLKENISDLDKRISNFKKIDNQS